MSMAPSDSFGKSKMYVWWDVVCFYLTLPEVDSHHHHPTQITIGMDGPFQYRIGNGPWKQGRIVLIESEVSHALRLMEAPILVIQLLPELEAGKALTRLLDGADFKELDIKTVRPFLPKYKSVGRKNPGMETVRHMIRETIHQILDGQYNLSYDPSVDERVRKALDIIFDLPVKKISLKEISRKIHLSPSRFRHIFKDETGIDFRNFVMQMRLVEAMRRAEDEKSLSQIAQETGFTDLPHMTRVFKRIGGTTPSSYINARKFLEVHFEESPKRS